MRNFSTMQINGHLPSIHTILLLWFLLTKSISNVLLFECWTRDTCASFVSILVRIENNFRSILFNDNSDSSLDRAVVWVEQLFLLILWLELVVSFESVWLRSVLLVLLESEHIWFVWPPPPVSWNSETVCVSSSTAAVRLLAKHSPSKHTRINEMFANFLAHRNYENRTANPAIKKKHIYISQWSCVSINLILLFTIHKN